MPIMHQTAFGGRPGSTETRWRSLCTSPDPLAVVGATCKGREGRRELTEREG